MALNHKFLASMGIEADKIETIVDAHVETVNGLKAERDSYKADAEKLPEVQKELDELKKNTGDDGFKEKYEALKKEYEGYKADVAAKELKAEKETAYRELLKDAGIGENHIAKVLKYTDWDSVELEDGKVKEAKTHIKAVKEEWPELIVSKSAQGAETHNPPSGSGKAYASKEEIMKIADAAERQKAIAENHEMFGF